MNLFRNIILACCMTLLLVSCAKKEDASKDNGANQNVAAPAAANDAAPAAANDAAPAAANDAAPVAANDAAPAAANDAAPAAANDAAPAAANDAADNDGETIDYVVGSNYDGVKKILNPADADSIIGKAKEAMASIDNDDKDFLALFSATVRDDLADKEQRESNSLETLISNCDKFSDDCELMFISMRDLMVVDLQSQMHILFLNYDEDNMDNLQKVYLAEIYHLIGQCYEEYQKNHAAFDKTVAAYEKLKANRAAKAWSMSDDTFEREFFLIYAMHKIVLEIYAVGVMLLSDSDDEEEIGKAAKYWDELDGVMVGSLAESIHDRLVESGYGLVTKSGRIDINKKDDDKKEDDGDKK